MLNTIDPRLNQLISLIYGGPTEEKPWQDFVDFLRQCFDADVASLTIVSSEGDSERRLLLRASIPPDWPGVSLRRWIAFDPFLGMPPEQPISLSDLISAEDLQDSSYFQDVLVPASVKHVLGVDICDSDGQGLKLRIRVTRGLEGQDFQAQERQVLADLVGHFKQALHYFTELSMGRIERNVYADAVNQMLFGVFILDEVGHITASNSAARDIAANHPELIVDKGVLKLLNRGLNKELYEALLAIKQGQANPSIPRVISLAQGDSSSLSLMVRPVRADDADRYPMASLAVVFLSNPMEMKDISTASLRELFGLTEAEARIAVLLANGQTIDEAADKLGVSKNTAKTHSRMVYEKTGVSRQVKLIQLISNSVARVSA